MSKIIPLVLELDETLSENEKMIGVQTIGVKEGNHNLVGYVATIKDFKMIWQEIQFIACVDWMNCVFRKIYFIF